jgi:hypothetical protein
LELFGGRGSCIIPILNTKDSDPQNLNFLYCGAIEMILGHFKQLSANYLDVVLPEPMKIKQN